MVHLAQIPSDKHIDAPLVEGLEKVQMTAGDTFTTSVYGSRFASEDLPKYEIPEKEMPKEVAYRMIKDDLSLDGNPMLNLASFVTTFMVCIPPYPTRTWSTSQNSTDIITGEGSRGPHVRSFLQELH
jgi:hypothetical protein